MSTPPAPMYTTTDSVKVRLTGKVQFQTSSTEVQRGQIPDLLLIQLINDAETEVEQDLRSRYAVPFRSKSRGSYGTLPDHSKRAIRIVVDLMAVMKVLATDFGMGTHVSGDAYYKNVEKEYKLQINRLLGMDNEGKLLERFRRSPPLEDMLLARSNLESADNGYRGKIINTDASRHDASTYASHQINDPSRTWVKKPGVGGT